MEHKERVHGVDDERASKQPRLEGGLAVPGGELTGVEGHMGSGALEKRDVALRADEKEKEGKGERGDARSFDGVDISPWDVSTPPDQLMKHRERRVLCNTPTLMSPSLSPTV